MDSTKTAKTVLLGYSRLLEYPGDDEVPERAEELYEIFKKENPEIAEELKPFLDYIDEVPSSRLEEVYSSSFDIGPATYIYAGHQLFGEGFKRSEFIVGLKQKFKEKDFEWGNELPDHMSVLVRFLAAVELNEDTAKDMINDCLLPSLSKMLKMMLRKNKDVQNPYYSVLKSLESYLLSCVADYEQKEGTQ